MCLLFGFTCAGLFVGRAAGQTRFLQLLLIVQDQLDSLHAVDAAAALRHQLRLKNTHNIHLKHHFICTEKDCCIRQGSLSLCAYISLLAERSAGHMCGRRAQASDHFSGNSFSLWGAGLVPAGRVGHWLHWGEREEKKSLTKGKCRSERKK